MDEEPLPPVLRLQLDCDERLSGRDIGDLIATLTEAYEAFQEVVTKPDPPPGRLVVWNIRSGSLYADFVVVGTITTALVSFAELRSIMSGFIIRIREVIQILGGADIGGVTDKERDFVESMVEIVLRGRVKNVYITLHGDNAHYIGISADLAKAIEHGITINFGGMHRKRGREKQARKKLRKGG